MNKELYTKYFPTFQQVAIKTSETTINAVVGGKGPALLLLHGYPQNLFLWRKVASELAKQFMVVASDLRGYGESGKPATDDQHLPYSKRKMAKDQVELMAALGHDQFMVAGHDRGARVAHRMALDHPDRVLKLAILDILPTLQLYQETDMAFATNYWHWFFLIQPYPLPETLLGNNSDFMAMAIFAKLLESKAITSDILAAYKASFSDPKTLRANCEDYRAGATIDMEHDLADKEVRFKCPTLILWGGKNEVYKKRDIIAEWKKKGTNIRGHVIDSGHFIPEEAPKATLATFNEFFI